MKRKLLSVFILIIGSSVLLLSCKEKIQKKNGLRVIAFNSIKVSKDPYTIEKMIPLETREDNLLKEFLLLRANDKGFFILDKEKNDAIHHFDTNGNYLGRILEIGEGPEMLPNINDFIAQIGDLKY
ncbi:6-bladed beta-propeller [Cecembia sp.]|uniref:6-bladed beta-propeller n=1 Tax=Cecembia sp. TaxID=1898110 RepID=UPI0025C72F38|nr:6-bladed beta-propeller [Cecembia sp.]